VYRGGDGGAWVVFLAALEALALDQGRANRPLYKPELSCFISCNHCRNASVEPQVKQ
jgi:hypothetical protein